MLFNGEIRKQKRVDLGGSSSRERKKYGDLQESLRTIKLEREVRLLTAAERKEQREQQRRNDLRKEFYARNGIIVEERHFAANPTTLHDFIYFVNPSKDSDFTTLLALCRYLIQKGDLINAVGGSDYPDPPIEASEVGEPHNKDLVHENVKKLVKACVYAVHIEREKLKDQLLTKSLDPDSPANTLLKTLLLLVDSKLPWRCATAN